MYSISFGQKIPVAMCKVNGQTMLVSLTKIAINDGKEKFEIRFPTYDAMSFYTEKCGFKLGNNRQHLEMSSKDMKKFIFRTQLKTQAPIVDIRV